MKLIGEFVMREIAGETILVPVGETALKMNGMITLDEVAADIWKLLEQEKEKEEILSAILEEYDIDTETAERDIDDFISQMKSAGLLVE